MVSVREQLLFDSNTFHPNAFDPNAFLFAIAIMFAGMALLAVLIIYVSGNVFKEKPDAYVASIPFRIGAMIVDITILRLIIEFLFVIVNPFYESPFAILFFAFGYNPIFSIIALIGSCLSHYLFFYLPIGLNYFFSVSLIVAIFGFMYFFICDAFLEGRTLGRFILRLKTRHERKIRTLSAGEAAVNALGKTFLFLDIMLGFLASICISRKPELRQIRLSQKAAGAVTMYSSFDPPSYEEDSDPFLGDENKDGELW